MTESEGVSSPGAFAATRPYIFDFYATVGLHREQHAARLDGVGRRRGIVSRVREFVCGCAGHPAILCHTSDNVVPSHVARRHEQRPSLPRFVAAGV